MALTDPFRPVPIFKGPFIQTILASNGLRKMGQKPVQYHSQTRILTTQEGIRLLAAVSIPQIPPPKGVVIFLHGWEGSIDSTYILRTGNTLFNSGYVVYRINLRDHGQSHHLNQGLFFATLLDEVFEAVSQAAAEFDSLPAFLVGFSFGGNFVLRIAKKINAAPIRSLCLAVAVSPLLDPQKSTDCIDNNFLLKSYFLRKWIRSLKRKQALFPDQYDFRPLFNLGSVRLITEKLISKHTPFENALEYFQGYTLTGSALEDIAIETAIIVAEDDPVIPIEDFRRLKLPSQTRLIMHPHGGHNGFIETILLSSWYERKLPEHFNQIVDQLCR